MFVARGNQQQQQSNDDVERGAGKNYFTPKNRPDSQTNDQPTNAPEGGQCQNQQVVSHAASGPKCRFLM
jgi:hypothetical protein